MIRRPRLGLAVAVVVLATAGSTSAAAAAAARAPARAQALAVLLSSHTARSKPSVHSTSLGRVAARRPLTGERTVLPVLGRATSRAGQRWLRVRIPGRPNGRSGWIEQSGTRESTTGWHLVIETSKSRVTVYEDGRAVRAFDAVVGKPSTPTPHGEFFVEESLRLKPSDVGAPYALALSARSNVLQEFEGGPGQIALHGIANVGGVLGSAVSHGCVRLAGSDMRWLSTRIGPGVPVTITN